MNSAGGKKPYWGIKIRKEVLQAAGLTYSEKVLYSYMLTLPDFFASNGHVAMRLGLKEQTVANAIVKLKKKGFIRNRKPISITQASNLGLLRRVTAVTQNGNIEESLEESLDKRYCSATPNRTASRFPSLEEAREFGESVARIPDDLLSEKVREWHEKHYSAPPDLWRPHLEAFIDKIERDRIRC